MAKLHHREVYLPQELIHYIQSFLTTKQSAQTSSLSKSWRAAWSTRPVLVFDQDDFPATTNPHPLPILCRETLNRYKTLNIKADKFVLKLNVHYAPLAADFLLSALTLDVNEIVINFNFPVPVLVGFNLPAQVFASTTLTRLFGVVLIGNRVLCSRLKSLFLCNVHMTDDVIRDILLGCPLIETLALYCKGLRNINVSKLHNLVEFRAGWGVRVEFMDGRKVPEFHHLRKLKFDHVRLSDDFLTKFSFMFPSVEDFSLNVYSYLRDHQVLHISSHSLRRLRLYEADMLNRVQLNVPNVTKFKFEALYEQGGLEYGLDIAENHFKPLPSLSFDNVPRDWESYVQLTFDAFDDIDASLFVNLRKFLIQFTRSRISLRFVFVGSKRNMMLGEDQIPCFPSLPVVLPVVENLAVCSDMSESILLALSRTTCPNAITKCKTDCICLD